MGRKCRRANNCCILNFLQYFLMPLGFGWIQIGFLRNWSRINFGSTWWNHIIFRIRGWGFGSTKCVCSSWIHSMDPEIDFGSTKCIRCWVLDPQSWSRVEFRIHVMELNYLSDSGAGSGSTKWIQSWVLDPLDRTKLSFGFGGGFVWIHEVDTGVGFGSTKWIRWWVLDPQSGS